MDVEIQSRQTQYGLGRINTKTATGHGRIDSAFNDTFFRDDYHAINGWHVSKFNMYCLHYVHCNHFYILQIGWN